MVDIAPVMLLTRIKEGAKGVHIGAMSGNTRRRIGNAIATWR